MAIALEPLEPRQLLSTSAIWRIDGTPNNDRIVIRLSPTHPTRIEGVLDGQILSSRPASTLRQILIKSGRGDDHIDVQLPPKEQQLSFRLFGGRGNDSLTAGPGRDILVGGDGVDHLNGGKDNARDVLYRDDADILIHSRQDLTRSDRRAKPPAQTLTLDPTPASTLEEGINRFAFDLYSVLAQKNADKNLFFSPYSIATALGMLAEAGPTSAATVAALLHQENSDLSSSFAALVERWNADSAAPYQLNLANAGWFSDHLPFPFPQDYVDRLQADFKAYIQLLDFADNTAAAATINAWISQQTHDRIPRLIEASDVNKHTTFVLTNAIYFKGQWENGFDQNLTRSMTFHLSHGDTKKVAMMYQKGEFNYFANDQLQLLELPYKGDDLSMVVLLPRQQDGLSQLRASLSTDKINQWLNQAYKRDVYVYLPRFSMDNRFELLGNLMQLGFDPTVPELQSVVSKIIHQANIDVNEEGTVAAAATAIIGMETSCVCGPPTPPTFLADHPFMYAIRDNETGGLMFLGQETEPSDAPANMPAGSAFIPSDPHPVGSPIQFEVTLAAVSPTFFPFDLKLKPVSPPLVILD